MNKPGPAGPFTAPYRHKDGSWVYLESTFNNLLSDPNVRGIVCNSRDVTERVRAEKELRCLKETLESRVAERTAELETAVTELKDKERRLRESEERFRSLLQNASEIITILDADGTICYQSSAAEQVLGCRPEEIVGTSIFDHVHPDEIKRAFDTFTEVLSTPGVSSPVEWQVLHADGSRRYLENVVNNLLDEPSVRGIVVNSRDITERKKDERRRDAQYALSRVLAESGSLQEAAPRFLEAIGAGLGWELGTLWMVNRSAGVLRCSEVWHASANPASEFEATSRETSFAPGLGLPGRVWESGEPAWVEDILKEANFPRIKAATREGLRGAFAFPIRIEGRILGVIEFFSDKVLPPDVDLLQTVAAIGNQIGQFIERKQGEEALRRNENSLATAQRIAHIGNWDYDVAKDEAHWSDELYRIFGFEPQSFVPRYKTFFDPVHPDDRNTLRKAVREALSHGDGERQSIDCRIVRRDGEVRAVHIQCEVIRDRAGRPVTLAGTIQDITERKRAEAELRAQTETLEKVNRIGQLISSELELQRLMQAVTDEATELTGAHFGAFFHNVVNDRGEPYGLYTISGVPREAFSKFPMPRKTEIFGPTFSGESVVRIDDVREDPRYGKNPPYNGMPEGHLPVVSYLAVPVVSRSGEVLGGLLFGHPEAGVFGEREEQIAVGLAAQAAIAIDNARLFESVRESEERFRLLVEGVQDYAIFMLDPEGRISSWNVGAERISGYGAEEIVGQHFSLFYTPEDIERGHPEEELHTAAAEGRYEEEGWRLRKDGSRFWGSVLITGLRDEWGRLRGFSKVVRDVTERKRAEEALRRSEELYRTVVEQAAENIFLVDIDTRRVLQSNAALHRSLGYTAEELRQLTLYDIVAHDRESVDLDIGRALEEGRLSLGERLYRREDGSTVDVEVNVSAIAYGGKEAMSIVAHDVTERKRAEESLRRSLDVLLALHAAGRVLGSTLESEEIGLRLLKIMQSVSGLAAAAIRVRDEEGRWYVLRTIGPEPLLHRIQLSPTAGATRGLALENEEPALFRLEPGAAEGEPGGQGLTGLCLPFKIREQVVGVLDAYGPESLADRGTIEVLVSLANQAASALENARLYRELAERERRLQELIGQLLGAQEEERRRVAYEVHDGLAQVAAAAHQHLQAYARQHPPSSPNSEQDLSFALGLVQQTVSEARRIIANLRPTALDDFGLAAAVGQEVEGLRNEGWQIDY